MEKRLTKPGFYNKKAFGKFYTLLRKKARVEELNPIAGAWLDELDAQRTAWLERREFRNRMVMEPFGGLIIKSV